ncbi:hypothetical protein ACN42_g4070 [Penicillium freii]|uniref:Uncharacterized protein n=1 Tax=Penicillium freii TaxID=48697 RepID=A0A101MM00_PENFR|nr:hypothetical protein ACN42_g4070 [Penicillium freii]
MPLAPVDTQLSQLGSFDFFRAGDKSLYLVILRERSHHLIWTGMLMFLQCLIEHAMQGRMPVGDWLMIGRCGDNA